MSDTSGLTPINGVDRERYGVWCAHGRHIMVVDPADVSAYPGCLPADPWPCDKCSFADYKREMEQATAEWDAERWADFQAMQG